MTRAVIPARERLIFAMDVPTPDAARRLADRLGDSVSFYKLGLELFMSGEAFPLLDELADRKSTRLNSSHNGQSRMPSSARKKKKQQQQQALRQ